MHHMATDPDFLPSGEESSSGVTASYSSDTETMDLDSDPEWDPDVGDHKLDDTLAWNSDEEDSDDWSLQKHQAKVKELKHKAPRKRTSPKKLGKTTPPVREDKMKVRVSLRKDKHNECHKNESITLEHDSLPNQLSSDHTIGLEQTPEELVTDRIASHVLGGNVDKLADSPHIVPEIHAEVISSEAGGNILCLEPSISTRTRRRIAINAQKCSDFASSARGIAALKNPIQRSDQDPNRGLYPVPRGRRIGPSEYRSNGLQLAEHPATSSAVQSASVSVAKANVLNTCMKEDSVPHSPFQNGRRLINLNGEVVCMKNDSVPQPAFQSARKLINLNGEVVKPVRLIDSNPTVCYESIPKEPIKSKTPTKRSKKNMPPTQKNRLTDYFAASKRRFVTSDAKPLHAGELVIDGLKSSAKKRQNRAPKGGTPIKLSRPLQKRNTKPILPPVFQNIPTNENPLQNPQVQDIIEEFQNKDYDSDSDQDLLNAELSIDDCERNGRRSGDESSDRTYGLVEVPVPPGVNYFERLPFEIMENIFSLLPMLDLALHCNRVCLRWMEVIESASFCVWKKIYHRVKAEVPNASRLILELMHDNGMEYPNQFLLGLIRYMADFKPVTSRNMLSCLSKHGRYRWVVSLFKERIPESMDGEEPRPWSAIAALIILSDSVTDVAEVLRHILGSGSQCTSVEITECLYCLATFLFMFAKSRFNGPWQGIHYRLFYALYLYENSHSATVDQLADSFITTGQQNIMRFASGGSSVRLTHEQVRIVNHNVQHGEIFKIVAFAGTGKTTTLVKYTQMRPQQRFLLAVFNKAIQLEASKVFPPNVECRTTHSLAYNGFGSRYKHKQNNYSLKAHTIMEEIRMRPGMNMYTRAKCIIDTVKNYMASAEENIASRHVPDSVQGQDGRPQFILHDQKMEIVEDSELIWRRMCDRNSKFGMSHDGYVKLYQLSKPVLDEYHCILIDEAQDLTPCVQDILIGQPQAKVLVGDPRQQIYAFRGAVDAMSLVRATKVFYLTQSFRFGPEIAYAASCCLQVLHDETRKTLVGGAQSGGITGDSDGQVATITRTNFELFRQAVLHVTDSENNGKSLSFVGGIKNFGFDVIEDIYYLSLPEEERGGKVAKTSFIKRFQSLSALTAYAQKVDDAEIMGKIKIVNTYMEQTVPFIRKIEARNTNRQNSADVLLTTAHKAKGLEFATVKLGDDFLNTFVNTNANEVLTDAVLKQAIRQTSVDERNLMYVAVTRAKRRLIASARLLSILKMCGEMFVSPRLSADLLREEGVEALTCDVTKTEFSPNALTLVRKHVKLADKTELPAQIYSPEVVHLKYATLAPLMGHVSSN